MSAASPMLLAAIPLRSAWLCVDCEQVVIANKGACPACGHRSLLSLAAALNRPARVEDDEL